MTLNELIERLEEYREELGGDVEVRLMVQQSWPFENRICGLCSGAEINADDSEEGGEDNVEADDMVYIVEGGQLCYGSRRAWEVAQ